MVVVVVVVVVAVVLAVPVPLNSADIATMRTVPLERNRIFPICGPKTPRDLGEQILDVYIRLNESKQCKHQINQLSFCDGNNI